MRKHEEQNKSVQNLTSLEKDNLEQKENKCKKIAQILLPGKVVSADVGSQYVAFWEDNIKKAGHYWKGQAVILILQEDKHCKTNTDEIVESYWDKSKKAKV